MVEARAEAEAVGAKAEAGASEAILSGAGLERSGAERSGSGGWSGSIINIVSLRCDDLGQEHSDLGHL